MLRSSEVGYQKNYRQPLIFLKPIERCDVISSNKRVGLYRFSIVVSSAGKHWGAWTSPVLLKHV